MGRKNNVFSIAFEGMHRSGKETQIEILKTKLKEAGIPAISIKGEGYRYGSGNSPRDPESSFWKRLSGLLKERSDWNLWEEASYRLARELVVWRDRILSKKVDKTLAPFGVLLIDRSLISKAVLQSLQSKPTTEKIFSLNELYPAAFQKRKRVTVDMVLPDIIVELVAPKAVLLSRLDSADPEYEFRKKNIETTYEIYIEAKNHLPQEIREKIVTVDSSSSPEEVYQKISEAIQKRLPKLKLS